MKRMLSIMAAAIFAITLSGCDLVKTEQAPHVTAGNEMAAMSRLHAIAAAEAQYQATEGGSYATLDELIEKGFVRDPSGGKLTGYRFTVEVSANGFKATAVPEKFPITGTRSFYVDQTNVMRGADKKGAAATASDPVV